MQDLSLNINVNKAQIMLCNVENSTTVHRSLLLEDDQFCKLLHHCAHNDSIEFGSVLLTDYVNENY